MNYKTKTVRTYSEIKLLCHYSLKKCNFLFNQHHYYQPMWTLVGAGIKTVQQSSRRMDQVLPKNCVHHKNKVEGFDPDNNTVTLDNGDKVVILYQFIFISHYS